MKTTKPPAAMPESTAPIYGKDATNVAHFDTDTCSVYVYRYPDDKKALRFHFRKGPERLYDDFFHHCVMEEPDLFASLLAMVNLLGPDRVEEMTGAACSGDPAKFTKFGVRGIQVTPARRNSPRKQTARPPRKAKAARSRQGRGKGITRV